MAYTRFGGKVRQRPLINAPKINPEALKKTPLTIFCKAQKEEEGVKNYGKNVTKGKLFTSFTSDLAFQ